jgi:hypothetical protein
MAPESSGGIRFKTGPFDTIVSKLASEAGAREERRVRDMKVGDLVTSI